MRLLDEALNIFHYITAISAREYSDQMAKELGQGARLCRAWVGHCSGGRQ